MYSIYLNNISMKKVILLSKSLSPLALKTLIEKFLDAKKAQDRVTIDLEGKSSLADYLIIVSGTSQRQVGSMAQLLKEELKKQGLKNVNIEGLPQCDWVLVDAGDVIVHIFRPEIRTFYNLEKMWSMEISDHLPKT
jgi:ribosome-associated protein